MEALNLIESFIQTAETGSFSAAARRLGLTPAGVSKNVARLEAHLGVRLFHRSTRKLTMTPGGEQLWADAGAPFASLQDAFARAAQHDGKPSGVLKVGMALSFGREYLVPLLGEFLERYPDIVPDWHFDNRAVDLIAGGFDAAIGAGIELTQGVVAREIARPCTIVAASPAYMKGRPLPAHPSELADLDGIARRSSSTGRLRAWTMRNQVGEEALAECRVRMIFDDPEAMAHAAMQGLGIAFLPTPHAAPWLESGQLMRLLPGWHAPISPLTLYYPNRKLLPAKTRVFIDFIVGAFRERRLAARFDAR
ncbi:LysR family transcriptional regulator [Paraburkholderia sp. Tr-20389]|uniref:LysR family transcriptional regulator n=1 Tax=Paraburkholderia sp. Tr-20389 TaxID=2703903 RepID=UPI0019823BF3|nr:LysR family transcriptional regulator [Paraburkholderia sp. Tr-20389]MBN3757043.1 LysR family transcriptional regulator [Paraburkholderia sp. Tr-20389]